MLETERNACWKVTPGLGQRVYLVGPLPGTSIPTAIMVIITAVKILMNAIACKHICLFSARKEY